MKRIANLFLVLIIVLTLSSCGGNTDSGKGDEKSIIEGNQQDSVENISVEDNPNTTVTNQLNSMDVSSSPVDIHQYDEIVNGDIEYEHSSLIVKMNKDDFIDPYEPIINDDLLNLGIIKLEVLMDLSTNSAKDADIQDESIWYIATLQEWVDALEIITSVRALDIVKEVELNYMYESTVIDFPEVIENPKIQEQWYLENSKIQDTWEWLDQNGYEAGGSSSVVVAVIDTGVDYNHIDLKGNMWVNPNEIPNNGIDDDNNGFIDDVHGVNVVSDDRFHSGDPMDDNGHGTHVAGIIGAENNKEGTVGVAYNSKIMALKAGNASGYFLQTDIAEAILYAYDNGADVINMSFGGTTVSSVVQDALAVAYSRTVLVAAAGNNGAPNQGLLSIPNYPAAYSYVIGVMSINQSNIQSSFSNYDVIPFNYIEYEMYAPGEGIISTLPGDIYASWSGTSMATPIVAGTAALLRSYFTDRDMYPNKFIMGQLAGTVDMDVTKFILPDGTHLIDGAMGRLNLLSALTEDPKPDVNFYDFFGFDSETIDFNNNGDGVIDAGELIDLGLTVRNRWGMADNVSVTIDALSQAGIPNPYLEFVNDSVNYGGVGTYSLDDNGLIINSQEVVGVENPFKIRIDPNTPNDMIFDLNVTITYENGLDSSDTTEYTTRASFSIQIRNGVVLPNVIQNDMTLTSDKYWIIPDATLIQEGVIVDVEPGTKIQFWSSQDIFPYSNEPNALLIVDGILNINGNTDDFVELFPAASKLDYAVEIVRRNAGIININYANIQNPSLNVSILNNCYITQVSQEINQPNYDLGEMYTRTRDLAVLSDSITKSVFTNLGGIHSEVYIGSQIYDSNLFVNNSVNLVTLTNRLQFNGGAGYYRLFTSDFLGNNLFENNLFINMSKFMYDKYNIDGGYYRASNVIIGLETNPSSGTSTDYNFSSSNNVFLFSSNAIDPSNWIKFYGYGYYGGQYMGLFQSLNTASDYSDYKSDFTNNYWGGVTNDLVDYVIKDMYDNFYAGEIVYNPILTNIPHNTFPFVTNAYLLNSEEQEVLSVGNETVTFVVEFSRDMDTTIPLDLRFGSSMPYAEYQIEGEYVTPRRWEGTYTLKTTIENGYNYLSISNGAASDDSWFTLSKDVGRFMFEIDTTAAQALIMQGSATDTGINLSWMQDDFETLAGYNVYRSTELNGQYVRLNNSIIPSNVTTFFDGDVEPGQVYYYNFTVVQTDLNESTPSGRISLQAKDTMAPNIYHTPIYFAQEGSSLLIPATIIDNVGIQEAKVYYRIVGNSEWSSSMMTNNNDKYSAIISSTYLTQVGFEYYIETFDGISYTYKGTAENPYVVTVQATLDNSDRGDVNGDGIITTLDALMVLQAINGQINLDPESFLRADLNEDGELSASEALIILQYVNGIITTLP